MLLSLRSLWRSLPSEIDTSYFTFGVQRKHFFWSILVLMYFPPQSHTKMTVMCGFSIHLPSLRKFFDIMRSSLFDECQRLASLPSTARAADTVYIVFVTHRYVVVDDVAYVVDIDTARCDIGSNQHLNMIAFEK